MLFTRIILTKIPLKQLLLLGVTLCLLLGVSACSIYSLPEEAPVPVEGRPDAIPGVIKVPPPQTSPTPTPRPAEPPLTTAYEALLVNAEEASTRGDYERALALLERAQRIDPDSADIYLRMANTHRVRGDEQQARAMAERGLLYCTSAVQCDSLRGITR